ncbi:MAG: zinc ribbon domain-containing protein [Candidatus Bathyarchaeota archaeon]
MVHCVKCGVQNSDDAKFCMNCGANLVSSQETKWEQRIEAWGEDFGKRAEEWGERFGKQIETEWLWLPQVGAIFGLLIGIIIILAGLQLLLGWNIGVVLRALGFLTTIIIGLLFIVFAIQLFRRRKS